MQKEFWVYILASKRNGTLYIGVTSTLAKRIWEHKNKLIEGFTLRYDVDKLVYFEAFADAESAITREKQMKKWKRNDVKNGKERTMWRNWLGFWTRD